MKHILITSSLALCVAGSVAATALTDAFSDFWVLGDSLSDPGNLFDATFGTIPTDPPYFDGRFSNGPVWAERLSQIFEDDAKPTGNFAFGGATSSGAPAVGEPPSLDVQAGLLDGAASGILNEDSLISIWFGANDIFQSIGDGATEAETIGAAEAAADNVANAALGLYNAYGVENFIIPNLPNLAQTPSYNLFQPGQASTAGAASAAFNTQLQSNIAGLKSGSGLEVFDIDTEGFFGSIAADPLSFGLSDTVLPCVFPNAVAAAAFSQPEVCDATTADLRLFFDAVHPNSTAHDAFASNVQLQITSALQPVPLPAGAPLYLMGLLAFAAVRRRAA